MIPKNHPRYESLLSRDKIVNAYKSGILADSGMIAHGRGEAFDYLIGEKTTKTAENAIEVAAAALILAKDPVISVNGNTTALVPEHVVTLAEMLDAKIEINLFYRTPERVKTIWKFLKVKGARNILGTDEEDFKHVEGLDSARGNVSSEGMYNADVILVPLEDGDRTEALVKNGKFVIAIDLNPLSRTAKTASLTVVDNITRAIPCLVDKVNKLKDKDPDELKKLIDNFNNINNLKESLKIMLSSIEEFEQ